MTGLNAYSHCPDQGFRTFSRMAISTGRGEPTTEVDISKRTCLKTWPKERDQKNMQPVWGLDEILTGEPAKESYAPTVYDALPTNKTDG